MWQHCNEALHKDQENWPCILEVKVNHSITELYALGPGAFANSNSMFKHPLTKLLQLSQAYKNHWLEMARIAKACQDRWKAGPYQHK